MGTPGHLFPAVFVRTRLQKVMSQPAQRAAGPYSGLRGGRSIGVHPLRFSGWGRNACVADSKPARVLVKLPCHLQRQSGVFKGSCRSHSPGAAGGRSPAVHPSSWLPEAGKPLLELKEMRKGTS